MENSENSKETTVSAPKAYVEVFDYPDSKTGEIKQRFLYVLNKDATRWGGIDLSTVSDEQLEALFNQMKEKTISDFSKKPKQELKEGEVPPPRYGVYKAFSVSTIEAHNKVPRDIPELLKGTRYYKYIYPETVQE